MVQQAHIALSVPSELEINKNIYGQFAKHLGSCIYDGFYRNGKIRLDIVKALKDIEIPNLRWPGGCFADQYHWKDVESSTKLVAVKNIVSHGIGDK